MGSHAPPDVPDELVRLIDAETSGANIDALVARLAHHGVIALELMGDPSRPAGLAYKRERDSGWVDVLYDEWEYPVSTALQEMVTAADNFQLLERLHIAMNDFQLVAAAAEALADDQEQELADRGLEPVARALEVGIVTMYARSFTGRARIGDRWKPEEPSDRELHDWLMERRHSIEAHADEVPERRLVTAHVSEDGRPIYAELRERIPNDALRAIAAMCQRQHDRLWIATGELKHALGSPATI
jgi:hypothetical protein